MKINSIDVIGEKFAYDGCHKIYILEDEKDAKEALEKKYQIYDLDDIEDTYNNSCDFRFISNWKLNKKYVRQCEDAVFEYGIVQEL